MSDSIRGYGQSHAIKQEEAKVGLFDIKQEPVEQRPRSPFSATITIGQRFELMAHGLSPQKMDFRAKNIKAPPGSLQKTTTEHRTSSLRTSHLNELKEKGIDVSTWKSPPQSTQP